MTPAQIEHLHDMDAYRAIPMQSALDQGWTVWWAQVQAMTSTAANMAVWELSQAIEHFYASYPAEKLELRLRWKAERDMDPNGRYVEMLVNGSFYEGKHHIEMEPNLHDRLLAVDGGAALDYVHKVASRSILSNRNLICERLNEAYPTTIVHSDQAVSARQVFAPDVQSRVERMLLDQTVPTSPNRQSRPRI